MLARTELPAAHCIVGCHVFKNTPTRKTLRQNGREEFCFRGRKTQKDGFVCIRKILLCTTALLTDFKTAIGTIRQNCVFKILENSVRIWGNSKKWMNCRSIKENGWIFECHFHQFRGSSRTSSPLPFFEYSTDHRSEFWPELAQICREGMAVCLSVLILSNLCKRFWYAIIKKMKIMREHQSLFCRYWGINRIDRGKEKGWIQFSAVVPNLFKHFLPWASKTSEFLPYSV